MLTSLPFSFLLQSIIRDLIFALMAAVAPIIAKALTDAEKQEIANLGFYHMEAPNLSTLNCLMMPPLAADAVITKARATHYQARAYATHLLPWKMQAFRPTIHRVCRTAHRHLMTLLLLVDAQSLHAKHAVFKDLGPTAEVGWVRIALCPHHEAVVQIQIADLFFKMVQRAIFTSYEVITLNDLNGAYVAVVMSSVPVAQALIAKITVNGDGIWWCTSRITTILCKKCQVMR